MTPSRSPRSARRRRALTTAIAAAGIAASIGAGGLAPAFGEPAAAASGPAPTRDISNDPAAKRLTLTDGGLRMVVAYGGGAAITSLTLDGTELLADGISSTVQLAASGTELDSRTLAADP